MSFIYIILFSKYFPNWVMFLSLVTGTRPQKVNTRNINNNLSIYQHEAFKSR